MSNCPGRDFIGGNYSGAIVWGAKVRWVIVPVGISWGIIVRVVVVQGGIIHEKLSGG